MNKKEFDRLIKENPKQKFKVLHSSYSCWDIGDVVEVNLRDVGETGVRIWSEEDEASLYFHYSEIEPYFEEMSSKVDPEGWIEWNGGNQPVSGKVKYKMRNLDYTSSDNADNLRWEHWRWEDGSADIIAYRIVQDPQEESSESITDDLEVNEYQSSQEEDTASESNTGASVEIQVKVTVQYDEYILSRDEAWKLYKDLEKVFEEQVV